MRIVILGGGISGLSAAWYARKKYKTANITLLEKTNRLGGSIETNEIGGSIFEKGPRTFSAKRSPHLLDLIDEMKLTDQLLFSDPAAKRRFLLIKGKLRSFFPSMLGPLLREPFRHKGRGDDESIFDFSLRRFGPTFTNTFIDPLTLGIYAGDIHKLSIQSCFPSLYHTEQEWGSLLLGGLFGPRKKGPGGLFTLKNGMESLISALARNIQAEIVLNSTIEKIQNDGVIANGSFYPADLIISALGGSTLSKLTGIESDFSETDLWLIRLSFEGDLIRKKGFGYLVPSQEKEPLLGMIWDSCVFPTQGRFGETRVTAMMREGNINNALDALKRHLGITQKPLIAVAHLATGAIPQFHVGYAKKLEAFKEEVKKKYPSLLLTGNYLRGPSVDSCIAESKKTLELLQQMSLSKIANTIRHLTMDAVELAGSGHPGLPMGCAEIGAYLFGEFLRFDPAHPRWPLRDRLILSAGHGSLWLYSCLHLAGFPLSLDDLKQFRKIDSKTPSHPDLTKTAGVEATTGVDGQGVGFAVGQALALKIYCASLSFVNSGGSRDRSKMGDYEGPPNSPNLGMRSIAHIDAKVVVLAGDGDLMEGVSIEACSLAGHLNLSNLILIYDSNRTTLDGYVNESFSEDIPMRFKAQGWNVISIDGHDLEQIRAAITPLRKTQEKPTIVIANTQIGYGSPHKMGTPAAHGRPLGREEIALTKKALGLPDEAFYVDPEIYAFFRQRAASGYHESESFPIPPDLESLLQSVSISSPIAGRWASHEVLQTLADHFPQLIGGSADLSSSDGTYLEKYSVVQAGQFEGRNIKYGVREFGMGCIAAGMAQTGLCVPFVGTFLGFVDYMRSAIRMTSLMRLKVIYQLTHDSIFIGSDGPTHQPIEQLSSLRAIPGLLVLRPADANEVKMSWLAALLHEGPSAIVLSRQPLHELSPRPYEDGVGRGAYILQKEGGNQIDYLLLATGSEVHLALEVAKELGPTTRVVSMPSWELFEIQPPSYKKMILQGKVKVSIEAGVDQGWHKYIGTDGIAIALTWFGESGSVPDLAERFGYTKESIVNKIRAQIL